MLIIILIITLTHFIYNISGIWYSISFLICNINFLLATFLLIGNPNSLFLRFNQIISLIYLSYILYINLTELFLRIGWA